MSATKKMPRTSTTNPLPDAAWDAIRFVKSIKAAHAAAPETTYYDHIVAVAVAFTNDIEERQKLCRGMDALYMHLRKDV